MDVATMSATREANVNFTVATSAEETTVKTNWTICLIANILIIILQVWIGAGFLVYTLRGAKRKSSLSGGIILKSASISVIVPVARYAATFSIIVVSLDSENDLGCEVAIDLGKSVFAVGVFLIFFFFWARQTAFYRHPSLGHTFGKCAGYMSKITIGLFVLLLLVTLPLAIFPAEYEASKSGCIFKNGVKQYGFRDYLYAGIMLVSQAILLGLFLYPLWLHHASQKKSDIQSKTMEKARMHSQSALSIPTIDVDESKAENPTLITTHMPLPPSKFGSVMSIPRHITRKLPRSVSKKAKRQAVMFSLMKRTLYLAAVAVVTDLITMVVVGVVLPANTPQIITRIVYDADLLINSATVLLSFKNWKNILLPFRRLSAGDSESGTSASGRSSRQSELTASEENILGDRTKDASIAVSSRYSSSEKHH